MPYKDKQQRIQSVLSGNTVHTLDVNQYCLTHGFHMVPPQLIMESAEKEVSRAM